MQYRRRAAFFNCCFASPNNLYFATLFRVISSLREIATRYDSITTIEMRMHFSTRENPRHGYIFYLAIPKSVLSAKPGIKCLGSGRQRSPIHWFIHIPHHLWVTIFNSRFVRFTSARYIFGNRRRASRTVRARDGDNFLHGKCWRTSVLPGWKVLWKRPLEYSTHLRVDESLLHRTWKIIMSGNFGFLGRNEASLDYIKILVEFFE